MSVTVFIPGMLRNECDGHSRLSVDIPQQATLAAVLDAVSDQYPRLNRRLRDEQMQLRRYINIFIDSDECRTLAGVQSKISDGTEVRVLPSVAGG